MYLRALLGLNNSWDTGRRLDDSPPPETVFYWDIDRFPRDKAKRLVVSDKIVVDTGCFGYDHRPWLSIEARTTLNRSLLTPLKRSRRSLLSLARMEGPRLYELNQRLRKNLGSSKAVALCPSSLPIATG